MVHIESLTQVDAALKELKGSELVLFDVDETLITPVDCVLRPAAESFVTAFIAKHLDESEESSAELDELFSKVLLARKVRYVDESSPELISELQGRGVKVMGLTAAYAMELGAIESMADWRLEELAELGFDFSEALREIPVMEFEREKNRLDQPLFKKGILFTAGNPKGKVLRAFLERLAWRPSQIIFIDDNRQYIDSVDEMARSMGIECTAFHYTAHEKLPYDFQPHIARFQLMTLVLEGRWLSEEEAKQHLE